METPIMKKFIAHCVTCQNENGVALVGFADDEFNTTSYLLLQRTLEPDEQDIQLGQDQIHVELNSPSQSGYGGIEAIHVGHSTVRVEFTKEMAPEFGASAVEVELRTQNMQANVLNEHLKLLVGDRPLIHFET
jgi:hypothetical protein